MVKGGKGSTFFCSFSKVIFHQWNVVLFRQWIKVIKINNNIIIIINPEVFIFNKISATSDNNRAESAILHFTTKTEDAACDVHVTRIRNINGFVGKSNKVLQKQS